MRKCTYFDSHDSEGWPDPRNLEPYFLRPPGQQWFYTGGNDGALLTAEGADGTEHLERGAGRIDIRLMMWGHPQHGVLLFWSKTGGGISEQYTSKGDLSRLREYMRTLHSDPMPIGLFVPFETAWKAVKEFLETDGKLPASIEWVANDDLPPNTFPAPHEV